MCEQDYVNCLKPCVLCENQAVKKSKKMLIILLDIFG